MMKLFLPTWSGNAENEFCMMSKDVCIQHKPVHCASDMKDVRSCETINSHCGMLPAVLLSEETSEDLLQETRFPQTYPTLLDIR